LTYEWHRSIDRGNVAFPFEQFKSRFALTEPTDLHTVTLATFDCRRAGLRMPAEWEPMAATWLGWPVYENRE
jgi:hypothetical protein